MVTDDGGEPLQNAHQSEKNHDGRRTAQSDDGKVLFAEVAGHQGVDCGCAHQRQIGDEDRGGEFGKRPEADIGLGGVVRNDFRVFVVGFDSFAHTKKDSRKGNPGERRRLWKTPQTFGVDIPQVESTFGLLCRGFYAELLRKRGFMRRKNEGVPRGLKCYQKNYFS